MAISSRSVLRSVALRSAVLRSAVLRSAVLRLGGVLLTTLLASLFVFVLLDTTPGDAAVLGSGGENSTLRPDAVAARKERFGLNDSVWVRFGRWFTGVLHGDLGTSIQYQEPVTKVLASHASVTLELAALAILFAVVVGVAAGFAAVRYSPADRAVVAGSSLVSAVPSYALGTLFVAVFAVGLGWFPSYGAGPDRLAHLILPAITLGLAGSAVIARITRASLRDELTRPHAELAKARGVGRAAVLVRHALPGAWPPIAMITGLEIAGFLGGAAIVESLFALPGLGRLLVESVQTKDFAVVQALVLLSLVVYALVTMAVDIAFSAGRRRVGAAGSEGDTWAR